MKILNVLILISLENFGINAMAPAPVNGDPGMPGGLSSPVIQTGSLESGPPAIITSGIDPTTDLLPQDGKGVLQGMQDKSENALYRRYVLQNRLIQTEPALSTAAKNMYAQLKTAYNSLKVIQQRVLNQTDILNADASAGGIRATESELKSKVTQASTLLAKMMKKLFTDIATDAKSINHTLGTVEDDYRQRIQLSANAVTAMLAARDREFAQQAYTQVNAMKQSASMLGGQFKSDIGAAQIDANKLKAKVEGMGKKATGMGSKISTALQDAAEMPTEIEAIQNANLNALKIQFQQNLDQASRNGETAIGDASDKALSDIQRVGMRLATQVQKTLDSVQTDVIRNVSRIEQNFSRDSSSIQRGAEEYRKLILSDLNSKKKNFSDSVSDVDRKSKSVFSDASDVAKDSGNMLSKLGTMMSAERQSFVGAIGKIGIAIPTEFQKILSQVKSTEMDINSDTFDELMRQNRGIEMLRDTGESIITGMTPLIQSGINENKKRISGVAGKMKSGLSRASNLIDDNSQLISQKLAVEVNVQHEKLTSLEGMIKSAISDIGEVVKDSSESKNSGLSGIKSSLMSQSSSGFSDLLEKIRRIGDARNDSMENLIRNFIGPNSDLTSKQIGELLGILATLTASQETMRNEKDILWNKAKLIREDSMKKVKSANEQFRQSSDEAGSIIDKLSLNTNVGIADMKRKIAQESFMTFESSKRFGENQLDRIRDILDNVHNQFRDQTNGTGALIASVDGDLSNANSMLSKVSVDKNGQQISSLIVSLGSANDQQRRTDLADAENLLANKKNQISENLHKKAIMYIDSEMSEIDATIGSNLASLSNIKNMSESLQLALSELERNLTRISTTQQSRQSAFTTQIGVLTASISKMSIEMKKEFESIFESLEMVMSEKKKAVNQTQFEIMERLNDMKSRIANNTIKLGKNLEIYQTKIDSIIQTIRSYMNTSSTADEMAIRHGIAKELAAINQTEIQFASMRAAVGSQIVEVQKRSLSQSDQSSNILSDLIDSAKYVSDGRNQQDESNRNNLIKISTDVDIEANGLRKLISTGASEIGEAIRQSTDEIGRKLKNAEGQQAKLYTQISTEARDIDSQSRKAFMGHLEKMDSLNDDILLTSKQLAILLGNANESIADISTTVMNHVDMNIETLAKLNNSSLKKIASVGDIFGIFSNLLANFLTEIQNTMKTVISEMSETQQVSDHRLWDIKSRSTDEINWLSGEINKTRDEFFLNVEQEKAVQEGLMAALIESGKKLANLKKENQKDVEEIEEQIINAKANIERKKNQEINKVRKWIESRKRQEHSRNIRG